MARNEKIRDLSELAAPLQAFKAEGKTIVHSHGVFDLLHIGHIRHLDQARKLGDVLVVTVTPDRFVNKGPHRPVFNQELRAEAIAALGCVDYVAVNEWQTAVETIQLLRPDFYVKGPAEREGNNHDRSSLSLEEAAVRSVGGQAAFTTGITFSSSNLVNQHLAVFPREVSDYLAGLPTRHSAGKIMQHLEGARSLKVLVVGEAIIDEYVYCETMGKSGKEPILAARYLDSEKFAGGILAVANHVAALCDHVGVLTFLGKNDPNEDFIRQKLDPSIEKMFLYFDNAPTIVKRRFVENYPFQKLFELYMMNSDEACTSETQSLCAKLRQVLPEYDVVIVTDYGHGMLGAEAIDILCKHAHFLAVNTQINAGNQGFHSISKYPRADYVCVSETEIRMEVRSRSRDVREIVQQVADKLSCDRITITRGLAGCLSYGRNEGFFDIPSFGFRVADRVGAGDAVLAITALCVAQSAPMEIVGFIGNVVGAQAVAIVGHRRFIEREALAGHVESLLK